MKRQTKTEAELLDHATNNLLRAVKHKILKKEGCVDYDKLRKEGYSDRFLTKVEAA
jgi:quinol monooxygenase YgiN